MTPEIIIALDYNNFSDIRRIVTLLGNTIDYYKVGLEAFISCGEIALEYLNKRNKNIFLDLKLHDIPNTVKKAAVAASINYKIDILSLHIQGGKEMIYETRKSLDSNTSIIKNKPLLFGITALTSLDENYLLDNHLNYKCIKDYVLHLASYGYSAGLDGVVCSVGEAKEVKQKCGDNFKVLCPGIRLETMSHNDQKRVYTPMDAKLAGADYIVIGRAVTEAKDPLKTIEEIIGGMGDEY
jgi:orotidine-5'-phosphate decarboxylase